MTLRIALLCSEQPASLPALVTNGFPVRCPTHERSEGHQKA